VRDWQQGIFAKLKVKIISNTGSLPAKGENRKWKTRRGKKKRSE
jgi:hypothetical protein